MTESFGARLRQQRERQLISLSSIADRTKINQSLLDGLERDDLSHWPAGIFRRSFVRAYAQAIGFNPEAVVREFVDLYPDSIEDPAVVPAVLNEASVGQRPPMRLRYLIESAVRLLSRSESQAVQQPGPAARELAPVHVVQTAQPVQVAPVLMSAEPGILSAQAGEPAPDLSAVAGLCTQLGQALAIQEMAPLLESAAGLLDAIGVVVWIWDPKATVLRPALAHGYPEDMLAKLPKVRRDTDNATAASFRSAQTRIVSSSDDTSGAVVVPLLTPDGCVGVLAVELPPGLEQKESVRAMASIFAAQLATSVGFAPLAAAVNA